jgi:hypothetical protein
MARQLDTVVRTVGHHKTSTLTPDATQPHHASIRWQCGREGERATHTARIILCYDACTALAVHILMIILQHGDKTTGNAQQPLPIWEHSVASTARAGCRDCHMTAARTFITSLVQRLAVGIYNTNINSTCRDGLHSVVLFCCNYSLSAM